MSSVNRIGFTELTDGKGADHDSQGLKRAHIVLVHGLRGHPVKTWTSGQSAEDDRAVGSSGQHRHLKSFFTSSSSPLRSKRAQTAARSRPQQLFWPRELLAEEVPQARVWTYGYNADVFSGLFQASNKNSVSTHGRDLAVRLARQIDDEDPIIFVAHSLGGVIVKDALRRCPQAYRQRIKLIIFLGTPHRGSQLAGWGETASNLARVALQDTHQKLIQTLEVNNEVLDNIHEQFKEIVFQHSIRIHSFQEARGISGMKGFHEKVVEDFSSRVDLHMLEMVESIDANHMQMARCKDRSDESYRAIIGVLKQFLKGESDSIDLPPGLVSQTQLEATSSIQQEALSARTIISCYQISPRNRRFIGRAEKLKELEERLFVGSDCQKLALVGLGGVGKTQVALQLAYTIKERWPEYSIFWVPAVSGESFEQAYRDIASRCLITLNLLEEDPNESVRQYLRSDLAGKWLLIVDNADDEEILFGAPNMSRGIMEYLPDCENGLILFTTRYRQIGVSLAHNEIIEIHEMNDEEAESFLEKSLVQKELLQDRAVMTELLHELTFLPLAITQAAAYLNTIQISLQEYLSLLRNTEQNSISLLSREFRDETRYKTSEDLKNAVAATWLVSFNHIRRSDPIAADLLSFLSCIEHKAIPRSMLSLVEPEEQIVHAIGTLRAYAFVTRRGDGESYDMHRLVHLAIKVWLGEHNALKELNEKVAVHLEKIFPSDDYSNRAIWREYLPHAFQFLRNPKTPDIKARYDLCLAVGKCLLRDGRAREAIDWLSECFSWRQGHFTENNSERLASQQELAKAYRENGQTQKAAELLECVVAIKNLSTSSWPDRLRSQYELASTYTQNRQDRKAIELLEYIVTTEQGLLKEEDPDRLASQHELAKAYHKNGQFNKAIALLESIIAIEREILAENHPERLLSQYELAKAYRKNGQYNKAIALLESIVAIEREILAENHPERLLSQYELAKAYRKNGQLKEAIKIFETVVAIEKEVLGESHPHRLLSQCELAKVYRQNRQIKEAISLLENVVMIEKEVFVESYPHRLSSQYELARVYKQDGQVKEAITLFENVVAIQKEILAETHPDRLLTQYELARAYRQNGQIKEAVSLLEKVAAIAKKVFPETHPDRLRSQHALSKAQRTLRSMEEEHLENNENPPGQEP